MNTSVAARSWAAGSLSVLLTASVLAGCRGEATEENPSPVIEVTTVTVEARDTPVSFDFVGKTASSRRVEVRARVDGFLEKRLYKEGTFVEQGTIMFQMDRKPFEAQLQAAEAELAQHVAHVETALANLNRVEPLVKKKAVALKELDDAMGTYRSAAAAVEAGKAKVVQAKLNLGYDLPPRVTPVPMLAFAAAQTWLTVGGAEPRRLAAMSESPPVRGADTPVNCADGPCCNAVASVRSAPWLPATCRRSPCSAVHLAASR